MRRRRRSSVIRACVAAACIGLVLAAVVAAPAVAVAQERGRAPDRPLEFDFQDTDLRAVLTALADAAGLNVVLSNIPPRTATLRTTRPVTPAEVRGYIESLARAHGLAISEEGGTLRIAGTPVAGPDASAAPGGAPVPGGQTLRRPREPQRLWVHRLRNVDAEATAQTLSSLFGLGGAGSATRPRERSLSEELAAQRLADPLREPVVPAPATPETPDADLAEAVTATSLTDRVQIVPDAQSNSLLIRSNATDYATLRASVEQIDVRPVQVLIEVLIAEVRRDRQAGLGVSVRVPDQPVNGATVGGELTGGTTGDLVLRALRLGGVSADVVLRSLAASADVRILSRPIVLARNNQEARILVGAERPFVQLSRSLPTDAAVRDQVVQYRDVGTQLTIRPRVSPDGDVSMSILQQVSSATAEVQFGAPVISTREVRTELSVRDRHTVVIGGLIDEQSDRTRSGVPFLKDIPIVGWLFGSTQQRRTNTELFIFLTPHVLRGDQDIEDATRRLRESSGQLQERAAPLRVLVPADSVPRAAP